MGSYQQVPPDPHNPFISKNSFCSIKKSPSKLSAALLQNLNVPYIIKGAELFWEFFFFFFGIFFFFGRGWFWGCPGSFLGKPRGERQVRAGFPGHLGVVLGLSRLRSGETSGEMQVPSRFGHKKLLQKANCPVHFCFLCVFIYVDVCVCVCDRVCSMCFLSVVVLIFHSMHFFSCICNLSI